MIELDTIDRRLLALLQEDGRQPNQALADQVGLSPSACLRRVRRLEDSGVITGYTVLLDRSRLGQAHTVFVEITLHSQEATALDAFEAAVRSCPGVMSCHLMAGDADYLLRVATSGVDDFARIHRDYLTALPGVDRIRSSFALRTVTDRLNAPAPAASRRPRRGERG